MLLMQQAPPIKKRFLLKGKKKKYLIYKNYICLFELSIQPKGLDKLV